ncbi:hypothetical protein MtrunA17_Chr7g0242321 [Medicago truncatula]|uniref:Transmembrane protein, putative n=1 Tax=Medicago truncatula TaxID=3880 RepID=G7KS98_MEDTR|nr:transmembrane protein, putative [Medicago truncatula]RHN46449.1 hypothetical protein MtrunA17_Chr7g0242321 [Medicago truncatula]
MLLLSPTEIHNTMLSVSIERPPSEPPPHVQQISCVGSLDLLPPSIQKLILVPRPSLMLRLQRHPRKPPNEVRITLLPPISSLSRPPPKPPWVILKWVWLMLLSFCSIFCGYHTSFVAIYEDESRFNPFAFYRLIPVQSDKVKKSETKYSRNVYDEAKKMIRNWIGKNTLDSHVSFVFFRRWKMLMKGLLGCKLWLNLSYLSTKFMCIANHDLVGYFSCIESLRFLGNVPPMSTLAGCNILGFMKC